MIRVKSWFYLVQSMGLKYVLFRIYFEFKRRTGILKRSFPTNPQFTTWISIDDWRKESRPFFFQSRKDFKKSALSPELKEKARRILNGEVQFFHKEWKKIEQDDWLTNVVTGHRYDNEKHWTEIPDFHPNFGDIKYVWERSRFSFIQTILRYDAHSDKDSSEWVFSQIDSWITYNPINQGPNYRCSQETSLRIFNWTLALYFYRDSPSLTEQRFKKIIFYIYWQMRHVRANIHFSRIAVRNNHAITETLGLYTAGLLFPFFSESTEWKAVGKKWFEEEIIYQIYTDGSYLQFSHNYHRVVIQLLSWAISLAHLHGEKFIDTVYERARASLNLLVHCQDPVSGQLPNYGANDGSLFFNLNESAYRDFRPSLGTLHYLLTSKNLYKTTYEDQLWLGVSKTSIDMEPVECADGTFSFPIGGIFGFRKNNFLFCISCVRYKDRPSQADALHIDVWNNGRNLLVDGGSYLYNTTFDLAKYFFGTESHNTVMIEDYDQMLKGPRFVWFNWSEGISADWKEESTTVVFEGKVKAYGYLGNVLHSRTVAIESEKLKLIVTDQISGASDRLLRQLWHVNPKYQADFTFNTNPSVTKTDSLKYYSPQYGIKEEVIQIEYQTRNNIVTTEISFA